LKAQAERENQAPESSKKSLEVFWYCPVSDGLHFQPQETVSVVGRAPYLLKMSLLHPFRVFQPPRV